MADKTINQLEQATGLTDSSLFVIEQNSTAKQANWGMMKNYISPGVAVLYSTSATYNVGDYVIYNGSLYRCKTAITTGEAWTAAHWTAAVLGNELKIACNSIATIIGKGEFSEQTIGTVVNQYGVQEYSNISISVWNKANIRLVSLFRFDNNENSENLSYLGVEENGSTNFYNVPVLPNTKFFRVYITRLTDGNVASCNWVIYSDESGIISTKVNKKDLEAYKDLIGDFKHYTYTGTSYDFTDSIAENTTISFEQISPDNTLYVFGLYDANMSAGYDLLITGTPNRILSVKTNRAYHHLRVYSNVSVYHEFAISTFMQSNTIIKTLADSINEIENDIIPRHNNYISRIFKRVVCVGDSYTSGYVHLDGDAEYGENFDYAWPEFMALLTGREWLNCGSAGATVLTWQERANGLAKARNYGKVSAYVIGLGINDAQYYPIPLGSITDIGTDAQTYYGGMSAIIRELNEISPTAKIFVNTCPKTESVYIGYNQAVRDIVAAYANDYPVFCIDLYANIEMYQNSSLTNDYVHGHYTPVGYEQFAEIYNAILSKYILDNYEHFQDVFKIPVD